MNEETVWLYKVLDVKEMTVDELQAELDKWSNYITPHELIQQDNKLIIRYQSMLNRSAYFAAVSNSFSSAAD